MPRFVAPVVRPGSLRAIIQPDLTTGDVLLRPWLPDDDGDIAAVLTAFADPEIQRWGMRDISDADRARAWLNQWAAGWQVETDACWAVARDGVVVARVALRRLDLAGGIGELAYWVLPDARGRGTAALAAGEVVRWAFEELGLHRVELWHSVQNEASCAVARRLGFALETTRHDAMLLVDGWHDMHLHAQVANPATSER